MQNLLAGSATATVCEDALFDFVRHYIKGMKMGSKHLHLNFYRVSALGRIRVNGNYVLHWLLEICILTSHSSILKFSLKS